MTTRNAKRLATVSDHRDEPGPPQTEVEKSVTTLDHRPPEGTGHQPYRAAALRFLATGMTAAGVREHASDAFYVDLTARIAGKTSQETYTELLAIADAIADLENHHLSPQYAYFLAGMDKQYGPYPGPDTLRVA